MRNAQALNPLDDDLGRETYGGFETPDPVET